MRVRLANTIDAWFEWEPQGPPPFTDGQTVEASALRDYLAGSVERDDRTFAALDTGDRAAGIDMIWLARRSSGRIVYC
jgi:hypothetical protein